MDLSTLLEDWDPEIADTLFWEKLHHQETLYPVTFASLPWLVRIAYQSEGGDVSTTLFLSYLLYLGHRGQPREMSARLEDHAIPRLNEAERLRQEDIPVLDSLWSWFEAHFSELDRRARALIPKTPSNQVGYMLQGPLAQAGSVALAECSSGLSGYEDWIWCPDCGLQHYLLWQDTGDPSVRRWPSGPPEYLPGIPASEREIADKFLALTGAHAQASRLLAFYRTWSCCQSAN